MSHSPVGGRGGTFCQFTVGSGERGASARHLRYIANRQAVREGSEGVWLQGFPALLIEAPYVVLTQHLFDLAHWLEQEEILRHRGPGEVRTHYQALLSFEATLPTPHVKALLAAWMHEAFPRAQAAGFLHRNTQHLHLHVWIAARQTDGRKINLTARAFRQLDEQWNRLYCRATGRDEAEHLLKKGQTERFKQLRREGKTNGMERPERVEQGWNPTLFNERERQRLEGKEREANDDRDQSRTGTNQWQAANNARPSQAGERNAAGVEPTAAAEAPRVRQLREATEQTVSAADKAVSEAQRLHQDAQEVAAREPSRDLEAQLEADRER